MVRDRLESSVRVRVVIGFFSNIGLLLRLISK